MEACTLPFPFGSVSKFEMSTSIDDGYTAPSGALQTGIGPFGCLKSNQDEGLSLLQESSCFTPCRFKRHHRQAGLMVSH